MWWNMSNYEVEYELLCGGIRVVMWWNRSCYVVEYELLCGGI